jgi:cell wall-associated NlpC family hydrolase
VTVTARLLIRCIPLTMALAGCAEWPETLPVGSAPASAGPAVTDLGQRAAQLAKQQLGAPYVFGGHGPQGFDCSGLVYYVYGQLGVSVPRTAEAQFSRLPKVTREGLQPGDLVFFNGDPGGLMHVGVYIGDDWFVHAPGAGKAVTGARLDNVYWKSHYIGAGRPQ